MKIPNEREFQQIASNHFPDIELKDFMKLYKDILKNLVNDTTLPSNNPLRFRENLLWNGPIHENKIKHKKAQYNLDKKADKIAALSSGNVSKYEFLSGKDVLPEKRLAI